jgi:hypothetical protein
VTEIERALIHLEIERLTLHWSRLLDRGLYDELPALFTEGGVYILHGKWDLRGREQIKTHYGERKAGDHTARHSSTNLRLTIDSPDQVHGTGLLTVYRHEGSGMGTTVPGSIQDFEDIYVRGADQHWLFAERRLTPIFKRPPQ